LGVVRLSEVVVSLHSSVVVCLGVVRLSVVYSFLVVVSCLGVVRFSDVVVSLHSSVEVVYLGVVRLSVVVLSSQSSSLSGRMHLSWHLRSQGHDSPALA
jgi:hypothetical protein